MVLGLCREIVIGIINKFNLFLMYDINLENDTKLVIEASSANKP